MALNELEGFNFFPRYQRPGSLTGVGLIPNLYALDNWPFDHQQTGLTGCTQVASLIRQQ